MSVWSANRLAENALVRPAIETSTAARVVLRIQLLAFGKNRIALVWTPNNFNCSEEPEEIVNFVGPIAALTREHGGWEQARLRTSDERSRVQCLVPARGARRSKALDEGSAAIPRDAVARNGLPLSRRASQRSAAAAGWATLSSNSPGCCKPMVHYTPESCHGLCLLVEEILEKSAGI